MELLAHHVENWAKERGLDKPDNSTAQALKLFEEAGELAQAHLKKRDDEGKDAVGDILVVLTIYCQQMNPEIIDNVNNPSHYQGRYGMESIDALRNFMTPERLKGFYLGNALKYQLRFQKKNGLEDLKKARKNLDWLIEEMENGLRTTTNKKTT